MMSRSGRGKVSGGYLFKFLSYMTIRTDGKNAQPASDRSCDMMRALFVCIGSLFLAFANKLTIRVASTAAATDKISLPPAASRYPGYLSKSFTLFILRAKKMCLIIILMIYNLTFLIY